jgi:hypothetical protein
MSSSTSLVDVVRPIGSAPRGPVIDVVFKIQWQMLPDPLAAPPWGPTIDVIFILSGERY